MWLGVARKGKLSPLALEVVHMACEMRTALGRCMIACVGIVVIEEQGAEEWTFSEDMTGISVAPTLMSLSGVFRATTFGLRCLTDGPGLVC